MLDLNKITPKIFIVNIFVLKSLKTILCCFVVVFFLRSDFAVETISCNFPQFQLSTFLDTKVYKGARFHKESILDVQTYYKPTENFQYTN